MPGNIAEQHAALGAQALLLSAPPFTYNLQQLVEADPVYFVDRAEFGSFHPSATFRKVCQRLA